MNGIIYKKSLPKKNLILRSLGDPEPKINKNMIDSLQL